MVNASLGKRSDRQEAAAPPVGAEMPTLQHWFLLQPQDQRTVASLLVMVLILVTATWFYQGGARGELIECDQTIRSGLAFQLEINRAEWVEFALLPGIGAKLAQRIVMTRSALGSFQNPEQLLEVPGIGPKKLDAIRPYLVVHDPPPMAPIHGAP